MHARRGQVADIGKGIGDAQFIQPLVKFFRSLFTVDLLYLPVIVTYFFQFLIGE